MRIAWGAEAKGRNYGIYGIGKGEGKRRSPFQDRNRFFHWNSLASLLFIPLILFDLIVVAESEIGGSEEHADTR